jgi:hypothetical protein
LDKDNKDVDAIEVADDRFSLSMQILGADLLLLDVVLWPLMLRLDNMQWPLMLRPALKLRPALRL